MSCSDKLWLLSCYHRILGAPLQKKRKGGKKSIEEEKKARQRSEWADSKGWKWRNGHFTGRKTHLFWPTIYCIRVKHSGTESVLIKAMSKIKEMYPNQPVVNGNRQGWWGLESVLKTAAQKWLDKYQNEEKKLGGGNGNETIVVYPTTLSPTEPRIFLQHNREAIQRGHFT